MANIYNEKAWIKYSQMPHKDIEKIDASKIQENLEFLDQKLELAQRKLSMFDFYRITTFVSNGNDYFCGTLHQKRKIFNDSIYNPHQQRKPSI